MSGLYIHFPFCSSKCIYCGFYSLASLSLKNRFLQALQQEISLKSAFFQNHSVDTIYFGGGTPSLFTKEEFSSILNTLASYVPLQNVIEFTIEVNPEQCTVSYLSELKKLGINRLSIGVQSFDDQLLAFLGRKHTAIQALDGVANAQKAGFENVSIDLIYGIPFRSPELWEKELEITFQLPITHLSAYALTVEENSLLLRELRKKEGVPYSVGKDQDAERSENDLNTLLQFCDKNGFEQYEISNFSKVGFESIHNSNYWNDTPYLGLGPSAHSYSDHHRSWNISSLSKYMEGIETGSSFTEHEFLSLASQFNETIMLGLRTKKGVSLSVIDKKYGEEVKNQLLHDLKKIDTDLYYISKDQLGLTRKGLFIADFIIEQLFIED